MNQTFRLKALTVWNLEIKELWRQRGNIQHLGGIWRNLWTLKGLWKEIPRTPWLSSHQCLFPPNSIAQTFKDSWEIGRHDQRSGKGTPSVVRVLGGIGKSDVETGEEGRVLSVGSSSSYSSASKTLPSSEWGLATKLPLLTQDKNSAPRTGPEPFRYCSLSDSVACSVVNNG